MAIQATRAMTAAAVVASFGETVNCVGGAYSGPIDAIIDRDAKDYDDNDRVTGSYIELAVLTEVAAQWGDAPVFTIDSRTYFIDETIDKSAGLNRYALKPT
ncbi:MAG: hypothetical protein CMB99_16390 [Flavobacteriaceae bacterium]|nr:hypothetical protein [Flavobacteriaceae bacterium]|tara:strand:- start:31829 stop:32131 length:303 start_codon:yes stop_codon:yes gene_type:complete